MALVFFEATPRPMGDEHGRIRVRNPVRVDDQVVQQLVLDTGVEVSPHVTMGAAIFPLGKSHGFWPRQTLELLHPRNAPGLGGDEPDMEDTGHAGCNHRGPAADYNDMPLFDQTQNRFDDHRHQHPRRGAETKQLLRYVLNERTAVFRHVLRNPLRQMMPLQHLLHELAIVYFPVFLPGRFRSLENLGCPLGDFMAS